MKKSILIISWFISSLSFLNAQQTVGLFLNDTGAFNGYTLFSPDYYNETYLIDNCGFVVNKWTSNYTPGLSNYLLENGNLLRIARTNNSTFGAGGTGGKIEIFDWNNNPVWEYVYSSSDFHQHHDVEYLPNGNILILAWEKISLSDVFAAGRNPSTIATEFWCEKIVEVEPLGIDSGNIIWEWRAWDHLIQDFDSLKLNYGVVSDHPELLNLNFVISGAPGPGSGLTDWLHCNSIDYNEDLDQIIISCHNFSEAWIIDHSTTTNEAASHVGGNSGKGGDLLYRWGNPQTYDRGTANDQKLFLQHDAHWIEKGLPDEGKIMIFNNGLGRPAGSFSSVEVIESLVDINGNYLNPGINAYGPATIFWNYTSPNPTDFYSPNISGAQRLANGNTLISEGASGHIFEVDSIGVTHWDYINPVSTTGPVSQGNIPFINELFKALRYAPDYPAFTNLTLTPGNTVELNPSPSNCIIYTGIENQDLAINDQVLFSSIVQNDYFYLQNNSNTELSIQVYDTNGKLLITDICRDNRCTFNFQNFKKGVYLINLFNKEQLVNSHSKIIKL